MGLLSFFTKGGASSPPPVVLPTGSFTVDRSGRVVSSTLTASFPTALALEIGKATLAAFSAAKEAQINFSELTATYAGFKITAREVKGGILIFLAPRNLGSV